MTAVTSTDHQAGTDFLAELFSSQVRAAVLAHMVPRQGAAFSLTELSRSLDLAVSSVQHECYKLERLGILVGRREGSSRRYRLSADHPLTAPLQRLVVTALGLETCFQAALSDAEGLIEAILASPGTGDATGVDLVLIGDLELEGLAPIQERIATILGIDGSNVAMSFFSRPRWQAHQEDGHPLVARLETLTTLATYGEIE